MVVLHRESETAGVSVSSVENRPRIMALDYGRKRIGIALSDELRITARPLEILKRTNRRNDLRRLREIVRQHGVRLIVLGYPLHLDGNVGEMAEEVARFARRVSHELGVEVQLADERLTSWEAKRISTPAQGRRGDSPEKNDDVAAAILLTDYLNHIAPAPEPDVPADHGTPR
jgi:putative Holliday junction resolvase